MVWAHGRERHSLTPMTIQRVWGVYMPNFVQIHSKLAMHKEQRNRRIQRYSFIHLFAATCHVWTLIFLFTFLLCVFDRMTWSMSSVQCCCPRRLSAEFVSTFLLQAFTTFLEFQSLLVCNCHFQRFVSFSCVPACKSITQNVFRGENKQTVTVLL